MAIVEPIRIDHPGLEEAAQAVVSLRRGERDLEKAKAENMDTIHKVLDDVEGDKFLVGNLIITRVTSERTALKTFKELLLKRGVDYNLIDACEKDSKSCSISVRISEVTA